MKLKLNLKQVRLVVIVLILVLMVGQVGYWLGAKQISFFNRHQRSIVKIDRQTPEDQNIDFNLFWSAWDQLEANFLDQEALDPVKMVQGAIRGMVASLGDPYTTYLSPEENQQARSDLNGSFEGVGIQLGYKDDRLAVIAPLSGMPAEKVGVKAGDLILKIEDRETIDVSLPEAVQLIRGPKGTAIKLTLLHEGDTQPYDALITRDTILVPSVEVEMIEVEGWGKMAHLKLTRFGERTGDEWQEEVSQILADCQNVSKCGVILDMRNNPGGLLSGSVLIASEFLDSGGVVIQENADSDQEKYSVDRQGRLTKMPLVVLINQGSASASEIVAGALQEKNRAQLVGETTFGKGTIQEAQDLIGGSGLHITIAHWLLPSGKSVENEGVVPHFQLSDNPETEVDEQLEKAKELLLN